jgi:hypothetical protein
VVVQGAGFFSQIWERSIRLFVDRERLDEAKAIADRVLDSPDQATGDGSSSGQGRTRPVTIRSDTRTGALRRVLVDEDHALAIGALGLPHLRSAHVLRHAMVAFVRDGAGLPGCRARAGRP